MANSRDQDDDNRIEWELIESTDSDSTERLSVPGGWLVRTQVDGEDEAPVSTALTFYPDPSHEWLAED